MKIIKQFRDDSFIEKRYKDAHEYTWTWGLGEDGELYYHQTHKDQQTDLNSWYLAAYSSIVMRAVSLQVMKRLVKEFGHLLVWI
ncbi:MAG TPA: hypothetical protein VII94_02180 [Candidatus Saccharimonadales bacterium]